MKRKLLEKKEWEYYVFEEYNTIELSIPIVKPSPGIKVLEDRIEHMKINFSNYEMNAWR